MNETFCLTCPNRDTCQAPCEELEIYLYQGHTHPLSGSSTISNDLMDSMFEGEEKVLSNKGDDERIQRKARRERGKAIDKIVAYLGKITGEEGKSLKYFLIWKMKVDEGLKHWEIAEIMGLSRRRISQIIQDIESNAYP